MTTILHTFKRGAWTANVVQLSHRIDSMIQLIHPHGNSSWPIRYANGQIGYDWDNVPHDGQRAARAAFNWRDSQPLSVTENIRTA